MGSHQLQLGRLECCFCARFNGNGFNILAEHISVVFFWLSRAERDDGIYQLPGSLRTRAKKSPFEENAFPV